MESSSSTWRKFFLILNCALLAVGNSGGPLIIRLYFLKGGGRIWLSSFLQTAGFPLMLLPLAAAYTWRCRRSGGDAEVVLMNVRVLQASTAVGLLTGASNYFYSYGLAKLPVSTSSLIVATQLAFTAAFAYLLVRQRFTAYSANAVVLLTVGAAVLGLHAGSDRPAGVTGREYALGFILTAAAAGVAGLMLPLVELTYARAGRTVTYALVLEIQLVMCTIATGFSAVGMLINKDFQAMSSEAQHFKLGVFKYYLVLVGTCILLQCFFLGCIGVVFYASSLLSGIIITVTLPLTQLLAIVLYNEKFQAEKGVSLFLTLWGFISYFFGEMKHKEKVQNVVDQSAEGEEMTQLPEANP